MLESYRSFIDSLEEARRERLKVPSKGQDELVRKLEEDVLVESWIRGDKDFREEGDEVVGSIEGYMDEVRIGKSVVEDKVWRKGQGGWVQIGVPDNEERVIVEEEEQKVDIARTVDFEDTLCMVRFSLLI